MFSFKASTTVRDPNRQITASHFAGTGGWFGGSIPAAAITRAPVLSTSCSQAESDHALLLRDSGNILHKGLRLSDASSPLLMLAPLDRHRLAIAADSPVCSSLDCLLHRFLPAVS